jgi:Integrase core domain
VDFARFRFAWGVRYALLVVLGYSRLLWCRFYPREDMATLIDGLEEALVYVGGVPQELLFDQMKAVITRDLRLEGGALVRNAGISALRTPLALHTARLPALSSADERQSRAARPLRARQFRLRPHVPARYRSRSPAAAPQVVVAS